MLVPMCAFKLHLFNYHLPLCGLFIQVEVPKQYNNLTKNKNNQVKMQRTKRDVGCEGWLEVLPDATCRPVEAQKEYIPFKTLIKSSTPIVRMPVIKKNDGKLKCEERWCQVGAKGEGKTLEMEELRVVMLGNKF